MLPKKVFREEKNTELSNENIVAKKGILYIIQSAVF